MDDLIYLISPISILKGDIEKCNIYEENLYKYYRPFIGEELYFILSSYKFFIPSYFLRKLFNYYNFSKIFGKEIIININNNCYNNTFIYLDELNIIESFVLTLSLINNKILNEIIECIRPIYNQLRLHKLFYNDTK